MDSSEKRKRRVEVAVEHLNILCLHTVDREDIRRAVRQAFPTISDGSTSSYINTVGRKLSESYVWAEDPFKDDLWRRTNIHEFAPGVEEKLREHDEFTKHEEGFWVHHSSNPKQQIHPESRSGEHFREWTTIEEGARLEMDRITSAEPSDELGQ